MSWILPDDARRLEQLRFLFTGLVGDFLPDRGRIDILDGAAAALWREPGFVDDTDPDDIELPLDVIPPDAAERFGIMLEAMAANHPHERHWYLNVLATVPERQGQGLGTRLFQPVLRVCDAEGIPAYLESTNPRNMTLYRRQGFVETGEIPLEGGPPIFPMWRNPR